MSDGMLLQIRDDGIAVKSLGFERVRTWHGLS